MCLGSNTSEEPSIAGGVTARLPIVHCHPAPSSEWPPCLALFCHVPTVPPSLDSFSLLPFFDFGSSGELIPPTPPFRAPFRHRGTRVGSKGDAAWRTVAAAGAAACNACACRAASVPCIICT